MDLDARARRLRAAIGFLKLPPRARELQLLHRWLDSWTGVGLIAVGLPRQGWDLQLTQYGYGNWRATFYVTGAAHSIAFSACPQDILPINGRSGSTTEAHFRIE